MLPDMKWLLFTVLSFQLLATPPCLAAMDCDMDAGHAEVTSEAHSHSSAPDEASSDQNSDQCDEAGREIVLADDATPATLCSNTSDLTIVTPENTNKSTAVIATASNIPDAPPDSGAVYPLPRATALQGETIYLRTLRIRL